MAGVESESNNAELMNVEIVDAPTSFKSDVWEHFGFPKTVNDKGEKITDKKNTISMAGAQNLLSANFMILRFHLK